MKTMTLDQAKEIADKIRGLIGYANVLKAETKTAHEKLRMTWALPNVDSPDWWEAHDTIERECESMKTAFASTIEEIDTLLASAGGSCIVETIDDKPLVLSKAPTAEGGAA